MKDGERGGEREGVKKWGWGQREGHRIVIQASYLHTHTHIYKYIYTHIRERREGGERKNKIKCKPVLQLGRESDQLN